MRDANLPSSRASEARAGEISMCLFKEPNNSSANSHTFLRDSEDAVLEDVVFLA